MKKLLEEVLYSSQMGSTVIRTFFDILYCREHLTIEEWLSFYIEEFVLVS